MEQELTLEAVTEVVEVKPSKSFKSQKPVVRNVVTVTINDKKFEVITKFNMNYSTAVSFSIDNNLELPNISKLEEVMKQIKVVTGDYWSANSFKESALTFVYCLKSDGKSFEQSSHKLANVILLKVI